MQKLGIVHRAVFRLVWPERRELAESLTDSTQRATLRWEFSYCFTSSGSPTILGALCEPDTGGLVGLETEAER